MLTRLAIILSLGLATSGQTAADLSTNPTPKSDTLGCVLTVEPVSQVFRVPEITVVLTNQTGADIYLVGSLDASDCRWRYPHCYFEVIGPDGKPASGAIDRCGNVNDLREGDFARVPPGGKFDPYHKGTGYPFFITEQIKPYTFRVLGKYRIRFFYSTASEVFGDWAGDWGRGATASRRLIELLSLVPKVEIASNEVVVEVVGQEERR